MPDDESQVKLDRHEIRRFIGRDFMGVMVIIELGIQGALYAIFPIEK
jgi:hypothetical protein